MSGTWVVVIEIAIGLCSLASLPLSRLHRRGHARVLMLVIGVLAVPVALGSVETLVMAVKIVMFTLVLQLAVRSPQAAVVWLVVSAGAEFIAQAGAGELGGKLGALPILMLGLVWAVRRAPDEPLVPWIVGTALLAEGLQAVALNARGALVAVGLTLFVLLAPGRWWQTKWAWLAGSVPMVYPIILTFLLLGLAAGNEWIDATASNVERGALAAWCVANFPLYPLVGPGTSGYEADTSLIVGFFDIAANEDFVDPHSFLLSAWLLIGAAPVLALHAIWTLSWWRAGRAWGAIGPRRLRLFYACAGLALVTYTLSPPDSTRRVQVALLGGLAIAGIAGAQRIVRPAVSGGTLAVPASKA